MALPVLLLAATGCANLAGRFSGPEAVSPERQNTTESTADSAALVADKLVATGEEIDAEAVITKALADQRTNEDDLLYHVALLLLSPKISDRDGARLVLNRLLESYPNSPRRRAANTLLTLLDRLAELEADNASLRQDLNQILDIDLEAERARHAN